jgi:hypothetical protein
MVSNDHSATIFARWITSRLRQPPRHTRFKKGEGSVNSRGHPRKNLAALLVEGLNNKVVIELLEKAGDGDFLRAVAEAVLQLLMESDVEGLIGAGRYERSGERTTWSNCASRNFGKAATSAVSGKRARARRRH